MFYSLLEVSYDYCESDIQRSLSPRLLLYYYIVSFCLLLKKTLKLLSKLSLHAWPSHLLFPEANVFRIRLDSFLMGVHNYHFSLYDGFNCAWGNNPPSYIFHCIVRVGGTLLTLTCLTASLPIIIPIPCLRTKEQKASKICSYVSLSSILPE
jgi:hypothetical protein